METTQPQTTARCYQEFCRTPADFDVVLVDRSYARDMEPRLWGYCAQHRPASPSTAETMARVTGSVAATYTVERRDSKTGELVEISRDEYRR